MNAVIPVKAPPHSKVRLAHALDPPSRAVLTTLLADHVAAVLTEAGLEPVVLSSGNFEGPPGVEVWPEEHAGLNRALAAAIDRTGVPVLVVPADLPWLTRSEVEMFLAEPGDVVIAAAPDGGTNGLLLRAPLRPAFGIRSAYVHAAQARGAGRRARVVRSSGFAEDLDDAAALVRAKRSPALRAHPHLFGPGGWNDGRRALRPGWVERQTPGL